MFSRAQSLSRNEFFIQFRKKLFNCCRFSRVLTATLYEKVKEGSLVVLIASQYYDFSNLIAELLITKDQLKNFIIMYYKTINEISHKLLLLHSWSLLPTLVAVDLSQLLHTEIETCPTSAILMQRVALCVVSLLAYLESVVIKSPGTSNAGNLLNSVSGIMILREEGELFGDTEIQTLKDLYFYKTGFYKNFEDVRTLMLE